MLLVEAATYPRRPPRCARAGFLSVAFEKTIERYLLAILPEPQRLARLQVADHGDELHLLAEVNLIHTQLC
jgi:hypothetical protein